MSARILFFSSEIPQTGVAGGLLLYRLMKGIGSDRVAVVGEPPRPESRLLDCAYHAPQMPWRRLERSRFNRLHRTLRTLHMVPLLTVGEVDRLLGDFRPDVVVSVMQFATWYDSAMRYARAKRIPLVTVVHDPDEVFDQVYGWAGPLRDRADGRFYRLASRRLCISPEMEARCYAKYGVHGEVMYPNRDLDLAPRPIEEGRALKSPGRLTVGYAGTLGYGYGEQIIRLLPAFRASGSRLVVYGKSDASARARLEREDVVELRGFVADPRDAWAGIQRDCDAVILPYLNPPEAAHRLLYSCHFPSKLPEYLALGMPVVVAGPADATGVRWAAGHPQAALTVTDPDPMAVARQFERLQADPALRVSLAASAVHLGDRDFEPRRIQRQFSDAVNEAAGRAQCASS